MKGTTEILTGEPGSHEFGSMEAALKFAVAEALAAGEGFRAHVYEGGEPRWSVAFEGGAIGLAQLRPACRGKTISA